MSPVREERTDAAGSVRGCAPETVPPGRGKLVSNGHVTLALASPLGIDAKRMSKSPSSCLRRPGASAVHSFSVPFRTIGPLARPQSRRAPAAVPGPCPVVRARVPLLRPTPSMCGSRWWPVEDSNPEPREFSAACGVGAPRPLCRLRPADPTFAIAGIGVREIGVWRSRATDGHTSDQHRWGLSQPPRGLGHVPNVVTNAVNNCLASTHAAITLV
jgi:hypothetical protein